MSPAAFAAQPYEQLADCTAGPGRIPKPARWPSPGAVTCGNTATLSGIASSGNWFLDATIRYGYQTWRAAAGLAVVFLAFWALSFAGQHHQMIVPTGDVKGPHPVTAMQCTRDGYPCFYPFGYTIDTVIPIINVHQADHWGPDGSRPFGWFWVGAAWGATAAGWALATLLVAGYTGLVRQD